MLILLIFLIIGILLGYLAKDKKNIINFISKFLQISIYLLLFVMGYKLAIKRGIFSAEQNLFFESVSSAIILFLLFILYSFLKKLFTDSIFCKKKLINKDILINKNNLKDIKNLMNIKNLKNKKNSTNIIKEEVNRYNNFNFNDKSEDIEKKENKKSFTFHEIISVMINVGFIFLGFGFYFFLGNIFKIHLAESSINSLSEKVLYALLLFVGMDLGKSFLTLKSQKLKIENIFLPFESILITFISSFIFSFIFSKKIVDGMIIYGGLGWYSLSSVLLSVKGLTSLAIYSFIHNVFREIIAIISAPIVSKIDPNLPILIGGATSMDVMLPFVQKYSGQIYTLASFYSGALCSISVSFIINSLIMLIK